MASTFRDKTVWITGGGTGIGKALAIELAKQGAKVIISGRRLDRLNSALTSLPGNEHMALACDVSEENQVAKVVQEIVGTYGQLDVCVVNAGFSVSGPLSSLPLDDLKRQFDVNVFGAFSTAKAAVPHLKKTKGRLCFVGSVLSMVTIPSSGAYASSKYAVRALGQTWAMELDRYGVSVTNIYPGFVESEIGQVSNEGRYNPDGQDIRPSSLMWTSEAAAKVMANALAKRKREYTFTGHGKFGAFMGRHAPGMVHRLMKGRFTSRGRKV